MNCGIGHKASMLLGAGCSIVGALALFWIESLWLVVFSDLSGPKSCYFANTNLQKCGELRTRCGLHGGSMWTAFAIIMKQCGLDVDSMWIPFPSTSEAMWTDVD